MNNHACSGVPQTVIITDVNYDTSLGPNRFDLSGTAFGAMAKPGRNDELRHAGIIDIQFKRWVTRTARCTEPPRTDDRPADHQLEALRQQNHISRPSSYLILPSWSPCTLAQPTLTRTTGLTGPHADSVRKILVVLLVYNLAFACVTACGQSVLKLA